MLATSMRCRDSFEAVNYAPLSVYVERALFLAEQAFLGREQDMDRSALSFIREVKRVHLGLSDSLSFNVILVPTLVNSDTVSAKSMGSSQNYLYAFRLDDADVNVVLLKYLGPVLSIVPPQVVDTRFLTTGAGVDQQFQWCEKPESVLVPSDWLLGECGWSDLRSTGTDGPQPSASASAVSVFELSGPQPSAPSGTAVSVSDPAGDATGGVFSAPVSCPTFQGSQAGNQGASCDVFESTSSKFTFHDVQGNKYEMLTKEKGHERADKLMFVTRAANSDRLPFLYGRNMTYNSLGIIDVIRNEHDEDENNSSVFSDLYLWLQVKDFLALSSEDKLDAALRLQFSSSPGVGLSIQHFREKYEWSVDSDRLRSLSSYKGRIAIRGFLENLEKVLILVYSAAFKGTTGLLSALLEGDALNVTSDGFIVYQIDRALASLGRDFADRRVSEFKMASAIQISCNSPLEMSSLMSISLSRIIFSFDRERRYNSEVNQGILAYPKCKTAPAGDIAPEKVKKIKVEGQKSVATVKPSIAKKDVKDDEICFFHLATVTGYKSIANDGSLRNLSCTKQNCPRSHRQLQVITRESANLSCNSFSNQSLKTGLLSHIKSLSDSLFQK